MDMDSAKDAPESTVAMTTDTVAGDLLSAVVQELKLLPDVWPRLPQIEQEEIIDRLRKRVLDNVRTAVKLIAADQRITVAAELKKVTFGDQVQAVLNIGARDPGRLDLAVHRGAACLIVVAPAARFEGGVDDVKGDRDQPTLTGVEDAAGTAAGSIIEQAKRRSKKPKKDDDPPLNTFE